MEPKKNPQKDLNRNQGLRFMAGLVIVMLLTFVALEWKTYATPDGYAVEMNRPDDSNIEDAPIFKLETPPPTLPSTPPPLIEIIDDNEDVVETDIGSTETNQEDKPMEVGDVVFVETPVEIPVTWVTVEEVPVFPGCENEPDKRECFQKMIGKHIAKNFKYPEPQREMGIKGKVHVRFVIQKDGSIDQVQLRGPDKGLEAEAARIIGSLPRMTPGKQRGTPVKVPFSIPITFALQ